MIARNLSNIGSFEYTKLLAVRYNDNSHEMLGVQVTVDCAFDDNELFLCVGLRTKTAITEWVSQIDKGSVDWRNPLQER